MLQKLITNNQQPARKLLVVDDEFKVRMILKDIGVKLGFEVDVAEDGERGLDIFKKFKPDIIISDIYMPKQNGMILMTQVRNLDPNCPVILITGYSHYQNMVNSRKIAPDGFILKPFQIQEIAECLLKLIRDRDMGTIAVKNKNPGYEPVKLPVADFDY